MEPDSLQYFIEASTVCNSWSLWSPWLQLTQWT